MILMNIRDV